MHRASIAITFATLTLFVPAIAADSETLTPAAIEDAQVAGGGSWLVMAMRDMKSLAVYDADKAEIRHILRLAGADYVYGAGGDVVLVYFTDSNILQRWNLESGKREKSKVNPFPGKILRIVMGYGSSDQAILRVAKGSGALDRCETFVISTSDFEPVLVDGEPMRVPSREGSYRDFVHHRSDRDLSHVTEWATSHSPSGIGVHVRTGKGYELKREHSSAGHLAMGDDGRIYTGNGQIFTSDLISTGRVDGQSLVPGLGGTLVLGVDDRGTLTVFQAGSATPIGPAGRFPGWQKDASWRRGQWASGTFLFDRRIVFDPPHGRILLIPPENDRVVQRPFDLKAALDDLGVDYLVVVSSPPPQAGAGKKWSYTLDAISSSRKIDFDLESAPRGAKLSKGVVTWTPSRSAVGDRENFVVLVKDGNGEQTYHTFNVTVAEKAPKSRHDSTGRDRGDRGDAAGAGQVVASADALLLAKDYDGAVEQYEAALAQSPDWNTARSLGIALCKRGLSNHGYMQAQRALGGSRQGHDDLAARAKADLTAARGHLESAAKSRPAKDFVRDVHLALTYSASSRAADRKQLEKLLEAAMDDYTPDGYEELELYVQAAGLLEH